LRHSNVSVIRNNVFINANVTKAEATQTSGNSFASHSALPGFAAMLPVSSSTITVSALNAAVSSFVPAAGSQRNDVQAAEQSIGGPSSQHLTFHSLSTSVAASDSHFSNVLLSMLAVFTIS